MPGTVVLASGGQDSTTCLAWAIREFGRDNIFPVSFDYQQRHRVELDAAKEICDDLQVPQPYLIPIEALKQLGAAALTNERIEVEEVAGEDSSNHFAHEHGLPSTFVPGRNMLFFTLACAYGATRGAYNLVTGVCEADRAGYPDCRAEFVGAAQEALTIALDEQINIFAPLLLRNKAKTWALAEDLGILELVINKTHTCYEGDRSEFHDWGYGCGECPACLERGRGFEEFMGSHV